MRIEKDTTINNKKVYIIKTKEFSGASGIPTFTTYYFYLDSCGLKLSAMILPFGGFEIVYNPSILQIKYPLSILSEWSSTDLKTNYIVNKKVIGTEVLYLHGYRFNCFKVVWVSPNDPTSTRVEWISKEGIIKQITNRGVESYRDEYNNIVKYFTVDYHTLKSFDIK